ncbi:AAA family ATPase, partial [Streptomyces luteosporeus]|uniref:AAA family ATPase n=1 Tax=Streptomyces luteosporeus TaxID=173856 RepID=UPI003CD0842D
MRLHQLTITAFGPFGGTQHIDFDDLSAAGLFLLHGPTGAGKTSVLDAVCYALYNEVPGARRGSDLALRSDHAESGTATEVVLEFTVAGRRLEVTRRPEQLRPKKRGSGLTKEKAFSALREKPAGAAEWKGLSRSHQEIGEEIGQLLGMSRDQFCQVVLLPQGDFARFLRAEDAARGKLLRSLFGTGRFLAVEEHLAAQRRAAETRVRSGDEHLLALAHRMQQAAADPTLPAVATPSPSTAEPSAARHSGGASPAGGPGGGAPGRGTGRSPEAGGWGRSPQETVKVGAPPSGSWGRDRGTPTSTATRTRRATVPAQAARPHPTGTLAPGEHGLAEAVLEWAALARSNAREALAVADAAVRAAEDAHRDARQHAENAARLAAGRLRHAEAVRRGEALAARRDAYEAARARLERAAAAESVAPALELREKAAAAHRAATTAEEQAREALPAAHRGDDAGELAAAERTLREELGALSAARRAEERAAAIAAETAALQAEARADEDALAEADQWLAVWESTREHHRQRIETARDAVGLAERLAGQLAPARRRLEAARRRDALARQTEEAEAGLPAVRTEALDARAHWLDLKERRLDGMAAELAAGLRPGRACAVCGATEHPAPARAGAGHVDRAAAEAALAAHQRAEARREAAEGRLRALRQELAAATAEAGDEPAAGLAGALAGLEDRHAAATRASHDLLPACEALAAAEREYERRREDRQQAGLRLASRTSRRENLDRERESLQRELDRARGGEASVAHRAALLEDRLAALAAAAEAARPAARTAARPARFAPTVLADGPYPTRCTRRSRTARVPASRIPPPRSGCASRAAVS